jgi:drug/metabolite transporter (DMT)-like permease
LTAQQKIALLAITSASLLPVVDAMVKILVQDHSVVMVAWVRMGLSALFLGTLAAQKNGLAIFKPVAWRLQALRGLAAVLGTGMVFLGFRVLPLAECLAIVFLAPVLANLMSSHVLKEPGSALSWWLALLSFLGVLVIARPGGALFTWNALLPLIGALGLATFLTLTRAVAAHDHPGVTAFYGPFVAFLAFSLALPFHWQAPSSWPEAAMFLAIGILAAVAQFVQTIAYRLGTTHQVAPFSYLSLVFAIILGWAVFGNVPDLWSYLGMAMITVAGLVLVFKK